MSLVILSIGILAIMQIFPSGLAVIGLSRRQALANFLAKDELERILSRPDQLPDQIATVKYRYDTLLSRLIVEGDENRPPTDLGPAPGTVDKDGVISDANGVLGYWPYLSGANLIRRVVGEGRRVPAPRQVGAYYGGLMILQFTPIVYNDAVPGLFQIHGPDLVLRDGVPTSEDVPNEDEYFTADLDTGQAALFLPAHGTISRKYRLAVSYYVDEGTGPIKKDVLDSTISVPATGGADGFVQIDLGDPLGPLMPAPGTFVSAEPQSVRIARIFEKIPNAATFADPYEYKLLDSELGLILFSEQAYNATVRRNGRRVPLEGRVNYDVFDWRTLRDEFRVPEMDVPQVKLAIGNLKRKNSQDVDGTTYQGLNLLIQDGSGMTARRDMVLMDLDTGGTLLEVSATRMEGGAPKRLVRIDYSVGLITFNDADSNPANGVQGEMVPPGETVAVDVTLTGRGLRAMFQAVGEWSVQVLKAPSYYSYSAGRPALAEFYIGGSDAGVGGSTTRIYFPLADIGRRITIDEVWYRRATDTEPRKLENQSFVIQSRPADPIGLGYVDLLSIDANADQFDEQTYGYAARGVRGATVAVRVLWNPSFLNFSTDAAKNQTALEVWGRDWRSTIDETFVRRPAQ